MGASYSIHISVKEICATSYGRSIPKLNSPPTNAAAMEKLARKLGVPESNLLRLEGNLATVSKVGQAFEELAQKCIMGDFVFISFSGHGSQVKDLDNCEDDGMDEGLLLFDGPLMDDQLCQYWAKFREGVRIFVLSDACHSGSIIKQGSNDTLDLRPCKGCGRKPRAKDCDCCCEDGVVVNAAVLSISAVRDNQEAQDGEHHSKFTKAVLDVFDDESFSGTYSEFYDALKRHGNASRFRSPELKELGNCKYYFKTQNMFHI